MRGSIDLAHGTGNRSLAAWDRGLGSVINGQGIMRSDIVREVAKIAEDEVIMTCVAMGYPDDGFAANAVRSDREHNEGFALRRICRLARQGDSRGEEHSLTEIFGAESGLPLAISIAREAQYAD